MSKPITVEYTSLNGEEQIRYHISEDDSIKRRGWYPQRVSLAAFMRIYDYNKMRGWWSYELMPAHPSTKVIECNSVWDFYTTIGWDYKRKSWL